MKLSVVIPVHNQIDLAKTCYKKILDNFRSDAEFIILDNGSDLPIQQKDFPFAKIIRNEQNIGVYPTFKQGFEVSTGDIVCFLHSDMVIWEGGWDNRVLTAFEKFSPGLIGFIGSNEIGADGGRGLGTASNFQGLTLYNGKDKTWQGSSWTQHGRHLETYMDGAVVDGCVMIISRFAWNTIGYRKDFPPHHFYDRLISTQMLENRFKVGILGIECDHISGQTVNQEDGYQHMAYDWLQKHYGRINYTPYLNLDTKMNYDGDIYNIAEHQWLTEYRDKKHLIPIVV